VLSVVLAVTCGAAGPLGSAAHATGRPAGDRVGVSDTEQHLVAPATGGYDVVAELSVGVGPREVGVETPEHGPSWGPASFDVTDDGRLYVLDGVNRVLHVIAESGAYEPSIPFPAAVACPEDVDVTEHGIYLLDLAATPPAVQRMNADGVLTDSWEIPWSVYEDGISGLRVREAAAHVEATPGAAAAPTVYLEIDGAWEIPLLSAGRRVDARVPKLRNGDVVDVPATERAHYAVGSTRGTTAFSVAKDWDTSQEATVDVYRNGRPSRIHVKTEARLGAVKALDADDAGTVYVFAEELAGNEVRAFVKSFDASGKPSELGELPLAEYATHPRHPLRVTDNGDVLALVPGADKVSIVRLRTSEDPSDSLGRPMAALDGGPEAPTPEEVASTRGTASGAGVLASVREFFGRLFSPERAHAAWTQVNAYDRAMQYCANSWYCSVYNYYPNGVNIRPRYITSYNRYWMSVPYCWGGWDLPSTFNYLMSKRYDAGDINTSTSGKQPSTAGTDCSGLVSRLWGLGHKRSTSCVAYWGLGATDVSYYLGLPGSARERLGDIYLKPNSHVMMVDYLTSGGARVFESTKSDSYDRVVHVIRAWSAMPGYYVRRYNNWWQ